MINNTIALADHVPRCHLVYHRLKLTLSHATQRTLRRALASAAPSWGSLSPPHLPMQFSAAVVIMDGFAASRTVSARLVASPRYECDADGFRFLYFIVIFSTHPTATLVYSAVPTTSPRLRLSLHCSWFSQHNLHNLHADPALHVSLDCRQHRLQLLTCHHCHHAGPCGLR